MNAYENIIALALNDAASQQPTAMDQSPSTTAQPDITNNSPVQHSRNVTVYQTTGSDAHTGPILTADGSGAPALNPRSCVTCRRRKVRCDKTMPCSNCRRAQIPCVFPAPGRAPRQPRPRDPNAPPKNSSHREMELMKRLRKLEGIVEELSGQIELESGGKGASASGSPVATGSQGNAPQRATSVAQRQVCGSTGFFGPSPGSAKDSESVSDQSEAARRRDVQQQFGSLVLNDHKGSARYVSSAFWAKLNDELDSLREETHRLTDEDSEDSEYEGTSNDSPEVATQTDHHGFIFGYRSADVDLQKLLPQPSHVPFLWSVYQENVEPLINLLHVPTTEIIFRNARKSYENLTPGQQALVFAIYYAAIASLDSEEVRSNLGTDQSDLLAQYRFAVEQALAKANFLNTSDIAVIQAFTIFLTLVRREDDSRFCWSLTGLVIHIAQGMGLHRDGSHFSLTPFETEMRRRVWWGLLTLDLRSSEELGSDLMITEFSYDTQMPSNIDDADIGPATVEFPEPKDGLGEKAVSVMRYEISKLSRGLMRASTAAVTMCPKAGEASFTDRERMLLEVWQRVESKFIRHPANENDPLYLIGSMVSRLILAKMCVFIYQPILFPGFDQEVSADVRQRVYVSAIEIMEYRHALNTDPRFKQYRWLFMTYTTWNAIAYTLIETCRRPWSPLVERGWEAVNGYERHPLELAKSCDHAAVFLPLRRLFIRAKKHRQAELARLKANPDEARRIEMDDRSNPVYAQFGPLPGAEARMEQVRHKWRSLLTSDEGSPISPFTGSQQTPSNNLMSLFTQSVPPALQSRFQPQQPPRPRTPTSEQIPSEINLSDSAMGLMNDIMTSNHSFPIATFWPINDMISADPVTGAIVTTTTEANVAPATSTASQGQMMADADARQLGMAQAARDDHLSPYLWDDSFTATNNKVDEAGGDDTDMLNNDFNWNDWNQSVRGLGTDGMQGLY